MARTPKSQHWPPYPHIPIYLETTDSNGTTRSYGTISPISPEVNNLQKKSVQYLAAASTQFTNFSTSFSPASPATQFTNLSPIWPIPEPPPEVVQTPPKRPALRFFPAARPRIQLQRPQSDADENVNEKQSQRDMTSDMGLGIHDVPGARTSNPSVSNMSISNVDDRTEPPQNIAQWIEQKLWRFSSSGNILKRWLLEIISWMISAACMGAIIIVLLKLKDKRIPPWPMGLTINTYVAILSKIAGAALILPVSEALGQLKWSWFQGDSKKMWDFEIFDNASRGPWGSFLLLIRTKLKALAALGALITIFSLALDPFFQQLVDFPDRWALQGNGSIPQVVSWHSLRRRRCRTRTTESQ